MIEKGRYDFWLEEFLARKVSHHVITKLDVFCLVHELAYKFRIEGITSKQFLKKFNCDLKNNDEIHWGFAVARVANYIYYFSKKDNDTYI